MTDPDPLWSDPHIPNRLQVPPGSEGVDSPAAARFRQAILTASAFINTPHDSDRSGYVQKLQTLSILGSAGISHAFLRLAEQAPSIGLVASASGFRRFALAHLDAALDGPYMTTPPPTTPRHCGETSFIKFSTGTVIHALCCHFAGLRALSEGALARLTAELCDELEPAFWVDPGFNGSIEDVGMYSDPVSGRSGFLEGVLVLRRFIRESHVQASEDLRKIISEASLAQMVARIVSSGQAGACRLATLCAADPAWKDRPLTPLMWDESSKSGSFYIGAGRGLVGVLSIILHCPPVAYTSQHDVLLETLDFLLSIQTPTGDLPWSYADWDRLGAQWCHGAGGLVQYLSLALKLDAKESLRLGKDRRAKVVAALDRSATAIWTRGLLRKGPGICHGIGGSSYVLLAAASAGSSLPVTTATKYRHRAIAMALAATDWQELIQAGQIRLPDAPKSLFEGAAGLLCLWGDAITALGDRGEVIGFPGMTDSGEP